MKFSEYNNNFYTNQCLGLITETGPPPSQTSIWMPGIIIISVRHGTRHDLLSMKLIFIVFCCSLTALQHYTTMHYNNNKYQERGTRWVGCLTAVFTVPVASRKIFAPNPREKESLEYTSLAQICHNCEQRSGLIKTYCNWKGRMKASPIWSMEMIFHGG